MGHFNHDLGRFVSGAEELQLHGQGAPLGGGSRRARTDAARAMMAGGASEPRQAAATRTSFPAGVFADPIDHAEITDVARDMMQQLSDQPQPVIDGFRQLHAAHVGEYADAGHHPDHVGVAAAADATADLDGALGRVAEERAALQDGQRVEAWARQEYGDDWVRQFNRDLPSMEVTEREEALLALQAGYLDAGGTFSTDPGWDPGELLEQAFDAEDPGPVDDPEVAAYLEENFEGGIDAIVEWLDGLPEDQLEVELDRLQARYEAHLAGELLPIDVLEEAGYDPAEVEAWLDGLAPEQQEAAVAELLGEAQHVLAGGEPSEGWVDDAAEPEPSTADRWAQAAAGDGYADDGGYDDAGGYGQGGEFAYAGGDGGYDGPEE